MKSEHGVLDGITPTQEKFK